MQEVFLEAILSCCLPLSPKSEPGKGMEYIKALLDRESEDTN